MIDLSIIVPVYNEEKIVKKNICRFHSYFDRDKRVNRYEILILDNGSTDKTAEIGRKLEKIYQNIRLVHLPKKGLGRALTTGIRQTKYPYIYFNAIDNPFEFLDWEKFALIIKEADLVFTSKNHPQAIYKAPLSRKLSSKILGIITRLFFSTPLTDTQGTFIGRRDKLKQLLSYCNSTGPFFQTQLAIYASRLKFKIEEVPVVYKTYRAYRTSARKSRISLFRDGSKLMFELLIERLKIGIWK